ncbi:MAG: PDDEXK nuclease domain-containing protein [Prevotellamassilia sp.]|nr:PDDEXK nuclease domain-containing protein [Bacteroidales bacterium]MDD6538617.1 PDDEXK nuclease domain-containing protein [Bacteroidales bacterium]MDY2974973.1 PDDEXK nuclease domain-containing protein [Alloprevotella sp.]MEE1270361.1 PDDEXK nuclease domain-containing protein [Prevotellamassilia sp.]
MKRKKSNKEDKLNLEAIMANVIKHNEKSEENIFIKDLRTIVSAARDTSYRMANIMQVLQNWLIGRRIVVQEQQGRARADYGKHIIELASLSLSEAFGRGFSETQVRNYRKFYLAFSNLLIQQTAPAEFRSRLASIQQTMPAESVSDGIVLPVQLSWSHYERLIRIADPKARMWYMQEAATQQWDYRTLKRNIDSQYYYRLNQTPEVKRQEVIDEMHRLTANYEKEKSTFVKNPMLVEFLGLSHREAFTESKLEQAILDHLEHFLMEMGKGYALVNRQMHIHTEDDDYYIDLVFYNYLLKCFVLVDLKTTKVSYEDVGQMDMYLKLFDTYKRTEGDNPTIGIILCSETNADVARFSTLATNKQMYASKYLTYMPSKEVLAREIEQQKEIFRLRNNSEEEV